MYFDECFVFKCDIKQFYSSSSLPCILLSILPRAFGIIVYQKCSSLMIRLHGHEMKFEHMFCVDTIK